MRVLLVSTNQNKRLSPAPLGLAYLVGPLEEAGHEVRVLDLMSSAHPTERLRKTLAQVKPGLVGLSIRNLDNQIMANPISPLPGIRCMVDEVRKAGIPSILGGSAFTSVPTSMLEYLGADYGIAGQGEDSLPRFVEGLTSGNIDRTIPGLVYRDGDSVRTNGVVRGGYRGKRADRRLIKPSRRPGAMWPGAIVTKTGCGCRCLHCDAPHMNGSTVVLRDPEEIVDEIEYAIATTGMRVFHIIDPGFNSELAWTKQVLETLIRRRVRLIFNSVIVPKRHCYDEELFRLYRRAGGRFVMVGTESLSGQVLHRLRKEFDVEDVLRCTQMIHASKTRFAMELMFGAPGETVTTLRETMDALRKVRFSLLMYAVGVRVLPNTDLVEVARQEGVIDESTDLLTPTFYFSPGLELDRATSFIRKEAWRPGYHRAGLALLLLRNLCARYLGL